MNVLYDIYYAVKQPSHAAVKPSFLPLSPSPLGGHHPQATLNLSNWTQFYWLGVNYLCLLRSSSQHQNLLIPPS